MHAPAPELAALRKLAEKHNAQYEKLLKAEMDAIGAAPIVDEAGRLFELEDKAVTRDGEHVVIKRLDVRSKRVVVQHVSDGHKQLLMGHRLKKVANFKNAGKAGAVKASAPATKAPAKTKAAAKTKKAAAQPQPEIVSTDVSTEEVSTEGKPTETELVDA